MKRVYTPLTTIELLDEFYETIKKQYPQLSKKEVHLIVMSCWKQVRNWMNEEDLPDIRLHYLGVFKVCKNTVVNIETRLKNGVKKKKPYYKDGFYEKRDETMKKFLNKYKQDDKD
jgi:hypothetical protein